MRVKKKQLEFCV